MSALLMREGEKALFKSYSLSRWAIKWTTLYMGQKNFVWLINMTPGKICFLFGGKKSTHVAKAALLTAMDYKVFWSVL